MVARSGAAGESNGRYQEKQPIHSELDVRYFGKFLLPAQRRGS